MVNGYWTKEILYRNVDMLLRKMNIDCSYAQYPLDAKKIAFSFCKKLAIEIIDFKTTQICGILNKGLKGTSIALNSNRDNLMQNFDCMHELIHYFFHKGSAFHCICSESNSINQDKFQEWQANEGAAQALVPYQILIPKYIDLTRKSARSLWDLAGIDMELASFFHVSPKVISNRINNLEYEIKQYIDGVPLSEINILSKRQITKLGLQKRCSADRIYCTNCLSAIKKNDKYCPICGENLKEEKTSILNYKTLKGVGYMIYDGCKLDQNRKAIVCPRCENEEIIENGEYCKICGVSLINRCEGYWETDDSDRNDWINGCGEILEGNARYCHKCGKKSSFYINGFLKPWNKENKSINHFVFPEEEIPF